MIRMLGSVLNIFFHWWCAEGFRPSKKMVNPDAVPLVYCCVPLPKRRKTSKARISLATHRDMVNELLSAGLSNHQNELKSEPCIVLKTWASSVVSTLLFAYMQW